MADGHAKPNHDYHLVSPSPWPVVGSVSAFAMAIGAILWMHSISIGILQMFGALLLVASVFAVFLYHPRAVFTVATAVGLAFVTLIWLNIFSHFYVRVIGVLAFAAALGAAHRFSTSAAAGFVVGLAVVLVFHQVPGDNQIPAGGFFFFAGLVGVLCTMAVWWADVIKEAEHEGFHTRVVQISHRYGMILFIASEVMFFVAWFWAFFNSALFPNEAIESARSAINAGCKLGEACAAAGVWPPKGTEVFDAWHLPLLNTLILLTSGTTVTWAHYALLHDDRKGLKRGLLLTVLLGMLFTCVQAYEYAHAPFPFSGSPYGATFFMATGFHGFHVLIGTIFLIVCLVRAERGHFTAKHHLGFEFAAWYWHFVDVVWLFLFSCIYVWGNWNGVIEGAAR